MPSAPVEEVLWLLFVGGPCWVEKGDGDQEKKKWFWRGFPPLWHYISSLPRVWEETPLRVVEGVICWDVSGRETERERGIFLQSEGKRPFGSFSSQKLPCLQCLMDAPLPPGSCFSTCSLHGAALGLGLSPASFRNTHSEGSHPLQGCARDSQSSFPSPEISLKLLTPAPPTHWTSPPSCPLDASRSTCPKLNTLPFSLYP